MYAVVNDLPDRQVSIKRLDGRLYTTAMAPEGSRLQNHLLHQGDDDLQALSITNQSPSMPYGKESTTSRGESRKNASDYFL